MLYKRVQDIVEEDVHALVRDQIRESRHIDYKSSFALESDAQKKSFLADVCAFANTDGGTIVYGLEENAGIPTEICGVDIDDEDALRLRVLSIVRAGLDPRPLDPSIRLLPVSSCPKPVLLIQIDKAWNGPHAVRESGRFYVRSDGGNVQMDVGQIRAAFAMSDTATKRLRSWREERLVAVQTGDTPCRLDSKCLFAIHIAPSSAFTTGYTVSAAALRDARDGFAPPYNSTYNTRINIDGVVTYFTPDPPRQDGITLARYCQVYRSGLLEAVYPALSTDTRPGEREIASIWFEQTIFVSISGYIGSLRKLGFGHPFTVMVSLLGAKGVTLTGGRGVHFSPQPIDRDLLLLPDISIDSVETDYDQLCRPIYDAVWNACGVVRSMNFDSSGKRTKK